MRKERMLLVALAAALVVGIALPAQAAKPGFVFPPICCFYNGETVRTVVPPSSSPNEGIDPFYGIAGGAAGQLGVVGVAPGAENYHGGHWAFHAVTWNTTPYLLTSQADVWASAGAGDVTVTRDTSKDFLCPIQP